MRPHILLGLLLALVATKVSAQETVNLTEPSLAQSILNQDTQFHVFVSQGLLFSTNGNNYITTKNPSLTEAAINATYTFGEISFGTQLYSRMLGDAIVRPGIDWAQLTYRPYDNLWLKAGRMKIPFGLFGEGVDIDAARVSALLPGSVYPDDLRTLLLSLNGGELGSVARLDSLGELEVRLYGGTFSLPANIPNPNQNISISKAKVDYVVGGRLVWDTPIEGLSLAGSIQRLRYEIDYSSQPAFLMGLQQSGLVDPSFDGNIYLDLSINRWIVSAEYQIGNLNLVAEYGRWAADLKSSVPNLVPRGGPTNERFYLMANYRLSELLTTGAYYSAYYVDVANRSGRAQQQHDLAATLRFDIHENLVLKTEGHLMLGTAGLDPVINNYQDRQQLDQTWGLLVVKATAYY